MPEKIFYAGLILLLLAASFGGAFISPVIFFVGIGAVFAWGILDSFMRAEKYLQKKLTDTDSEDSHR